VSQPSPPSPPFPRFLSPPPSADQSGWKILLWLLVGFAAPLVLTGFLLVTVPFLVIYYAVKLAKGAVRWPTLVQEAGESPAAQGLAIIMGVIAGLVTFYFVYHAAFPNAAEVAAITANTTLAEAASVVATAVANSTSA
jgi:hypothetical protein